MLLGLVVSPVLADEPAAQTSKAVADSLVLPGETHLSNIRQITFGGQNAEAYWNREGTELLFQSERDGRGCDAIYRMNGDGSNVRMVSNGRGSTTCSFIAPDGQAIIYASTHLVDSVCPPKPDMSRGYVWALYKAYDIFKADPDGSNPVQLTTTDGYDAEAVYSPKGDKILFTSVRTGDLELYLMNPDGSGVEQVTNMPGYDGGAFFSYDGEWICWRASRPTGEALTDYQTLLAEGFIRPSKLEIYIMNLKERKPIQLTSNGKANFAPYFHPNGKQLIFCSNMNDPKGRNFDLFLLNIETKEIEQVTHNESFDGFPMFTHDGKRLVFASNRNGKVQGETNIFVADWK
ncbi:MAG: PD40 domain-containing protein [bacterium]|nr:PD40 domain-containing protein [bacterium]